MAAAENNGKPVVKIFIAYPGDCKSARNSIVSIIEGKDYRWHEHFDIRLVYWEDPDQPVLGDWNTAPQKSVVQHVGDPAGCDLLIALFHSRIGSPLPEAEFGRDDNDTLWTGTCWELAQASKVGRDCWVFRNVAEASINLMELPEEEALDALKQASALKHFFTANIKDQEGAYCRSAFEYSQPEQFAEMVSDKLRRWFEDLLSGAISTPQKTSAGSTSVTSLNAAQQELLTRIINQENLDYEAMEKAQRERFDVLLADVYQSPVNSLQAHLLKHFAQWANRDGGRLQNKFVRLDLQIHRGADSDTGFYEKRGETHDSLTDLLAANADVRGLVLTGDPGCGKTTILQHHDMHSAAEALRVLSQQDGDAAVLELCLWHRLSGFSADDTPADWLQRQKHELTSDQLIAWQQQEPRLRVRYLLDGLNEIRVNSDRQYREGLRLWSAWAAQGEQRGELAPVFSVRRRNLSPALTSGELHIHQISVQRWSDENIREYINHRFGVDTDAADTLWQQIDADPRLREQCSLPLDLKHQCDIYAELGRAAQSRAELFGALCWQRLLRLHSREELDDLLHKKDVRALDSGAQWKRRLLNLPDRGPLLQTLYEEAVSMHRDGVQVERDEESLALTLDDNLQESWCDAMLKLPFLEAVSEENPSLRFIHQNWQEYFAGVALAQMPEGQWPDFSAPEPQALNKVRSELGNLDPLPGPPISHWDEAVKFAVQYASGEQRMVLLNRLQTQNLSLAGRAVAALQHRTDSASVVDDSSVQESSLDKGWISQLRRSLLKRSRDPAVDVRLRIEAAEALGELGDPRYQRCVSEEGVSYLLPKDEYWIAFPTGSYTVGSEDGQDNEKPPVQVNLPAFSVAFATVTNAEYRCFIDSGGYRDERWWPGAAGEWVRGEWRDQSVIDWWQERLTAVRLIIEQNDSDDDRLDAVQALDLLTGVSSAGAENWLNSAKLPKETADAWLEQCYGKGNPKAESAYWRDTRFNHSAQPVVGVSVFEAVAYTRWISHCSSRPMQLPTEAHWEAAARSESARGWPFESPADDAAAQFNHELTHLRRAAPVGCFPEGDSDEGLLDMAGNVWEWTATNYIAELSADTLTVYAADNDSVPRVLRGGGYNDTAFNCRPSYRYNYTPGFRNYNNGFRLFGCPIHER